ncbi:PREDICTED: probable malonyl-CoA-acyl carrier protein transacylase, mitochondrial [Priapulus caudatus]|uniref:Probable malonyl-CoA-acyl carrier protein transacylase, mitochondrial n=1 Tax=Priapulus caudatus TaxID=37621 RepID=A0ABM1FAX4_PRICU|nr:PREDICTED: probable malonyl-CoA-acyl carrier protein transacylase, mitochondrial [Priapulus caudatus]XP_014681596.1 PREDICTED: probable malonyl-CoA-acyl carrier protein transacylase, mitochondrial [Priapulus caudatus]
MLLRLFRRFTLHPNLSLHLPRNSQSVCVVCNNKFGLRSLYSSKQFRSPLNNNSDSRDEPQGGETQPQEQSPAKVDVKGLLDDAVVGEHEASHPSDAWTQSLYPDTTNPKQSQAAKSYRPNVDPCETSIFLFPGQGSQFVGMANGVLEYPNTLELFKVASDILKFDLLNLVSEGPKSQLDKTVNCQPALLVTSLAAVEKLRCTNPKAIEQCITAAGFSVGEYAALVFAGAISFEDALRIVSLRAQAMQEASEATPSGMYSVFVSSQSRLGLACELARDWCKKHGIVKPECGIANYMYPGCKVVAGHDEALKFILLNKEEFGLLRMRRLPVSGAFHTPLMGEVIGPLRDALKQIEIRAPLIHVHSNVDGMRYRNPEHIRKQLVKQVLKPVKWEQTMHAIYERKPDVLFPRTYEVGPGKQLTTILKMVNRKAADICTPVL